MLSLCVNRSEGRVEVKKELTEMDGIKGLWILDFGFWVEAERQAALKSQIQNRLHPLYPVHPVRICLAALASVLLILGCCQSLKADEPARGVVVERVACRESGEQTYALFLPTGYTVERKWPVLYAFDPMARGRVPVDRFKEAAEKYGYIVVGSNNSRNGPVKASLEAMEAVWRDTHERFAIDDKRVYTTGFSGGARMATLTATACENCVAGVIACGAGFNRAAPPSKSTSFAVFATVGVDDFNYPELAELDTELEKNGVPHRIATFEGGHAWPPAELCLEALEWMEIQAIRNGRRVRDEAFVRALFDKTLRRARSLEEQKKAYEAYGLYQALVVSYKGLVETGEVERKVSELKASGEVKERIKEERAQLERQRMVTVGIVQLTRLLSNPEEHETALGDLRRRVAELRKKAEATEDTGERRVARRALRQVFAQFYEAGTIEYVKDRQAAREQLELAAEVAPRDPSPFYQLAILYAQGGEKRKALEALKRAVENGLKDPALIEGNPNLARLREEAEYRKIIETLKTK
jgi:predicted esterase